MRNLLVILYLMSMPLVYGLAKDHWRQFYKSHKYVGYKNGLEIFIISTSLSGPLGLMQITFFNIAMGYTFGLCYRMPKELCHPRKEWLDFIRENPVFSNYL